MHGRAIPPLWIPALRGRKDFSSTVAFRNLFYAFNTTRPPFDNALVRYAFHMATNKHQITQFLAGGQTPACTVIPPFGGYESIATLPVEAGGRIWDVLSHDPESARALMNIAGAGRLVFDLTFPNRPRSKEMAQILQNQWRVNLDAEVKLVTMDSSVWGQTLMSMTYRGAIESGGGADYADPNSFFELFTGRADGSGWNDPEFSRMVDHANAEAKAPARMRKLAACEERLLRAMPVLPLFFDSYSYLQKPYVGGLTREFDAPQFKYTWIDTHWRPS
jgi:ABC-type oligopeptide transport system substrate-binding subunit